MYVDVHTHLTHPKFADDKHEVIKAAIAAGLKAIVVNGLEPASNREILELADAYEEIKPALGIYPVDAVCDLLDDTFPFTVKKFDVDAEVKFIGEQASAGNLAAVGECGLDGHWLGEETYKRQEQVFENLIAIATSNNLPIIIHTRKLEKRTAEILAHHNVKKVNFHCYGGRTKFALEWAEKYNWHFSIPANANKNQAFAKMLKILPLENILTETDAPFLAPVSGERNEPKNVRGTVEIFAELRDLDLEQAKLQIWTNYQNLFSYDPQNKKPPL